MLFIDTFKVCRQIVWNIVMDEYNKTALNYYHICVVLLYIITNYYNITIVSLLVLLFQIYC